MDEKGWRLPTWAVVALCIAPLLGFWAYGLFDLDEGFYAAVVADMMRRGDWITPTLNGAPWFEKPILAYWLAIPSVAVFGEQWGPRLPSVLCTLATTWTLFRFVRRHVDDRAARLVAMVYGTNLLVVALGRMMMTDAPLVLCLTIAMTQLADWRLSDGCPIGLKRWACIGAAIGFGVLAKGPVAILLFGAVFLFSTIFVPAFRGAWKSAWPVGLLVCGIVAALWYWPCYVVNGQLFVDKFLIEQNIGRFSGGDRAHSVPFWSHPLYYPVILFLTALPWIVPALGRRAKAPTTDFQKFCTVWFLVPLAFFTVSGTKLPHYILPSVPPLAILIGMRLQAKNPNRSWEKWAVVWSPVLLVLAQTVFTLDWTNRMKDVQSLARRAGQDDAPLYLYQLGRQGPSSTGTFKLDDTSHPSVYFYYHPKSGPPAIEAEALADLRSAQPGSYVLTQKGRLSELDREYLRSSGTDPQPLVVEAGKYELWVLRSWHPRL